MSKSGSSHWSSALVRFLVGFLIVVASGGLIAWHIHAWRRFLAGQAPAAPGEDVDTTDTSKKPIQQNGDHHTLDTKAADRKPDKSPYIISDSAVHRHHLRQAIHRSITTGLIGVVGILLMASRFVTDPNLYAWGLFSIVVIVLLVFTSAMVDALRTQLFFQRNDQGFRQARRDLVNEYQRLKAKEKKLKSAIQEDPADEN